MKRLIAAAFCAAVLTPAAALAADTYEIMGKDGKKIGDVTLNEGPEGVLMAVTIQPGGLTPGKHGLHFHENGDCSDVGKFEKSGKHAGHGDGEHGLLNPDGPEPGDLPNIFAFSDGSANAEFFTEEMELEDLKEDNGSALLVHEKEDDQKSQPIGNAGARVACAVIK